MATEMITTVKVSHSRISSARERYLQFRGVTDGLMLQRAAVWRKSGFPLKRNPERSRLLSDRRLSPTSPLPGNARWSDCIRAINDEYPEPRV